jgi:hypothetical protein
MQPEIAVLAAALCLLGLIAGAAHGELAAFGGAATGLAAGMWIAARQAARDAAVQARLRELDDKARWLYEALNAQSAAGSEPPGVRPSSQPPKSCRRKPWPRRNRSARRRRTCLRPIFRRAKRHLRSARRLHRSMR